MASAIVKMAASTISCPIPLAQSLICPIMEANSKEPNVTQSHTKRKRMGSID
jgi:hypothetical protein